VTAAAGYLGRVKILTLRNLVGTLTRAQRLTPLAPPRGKGNPVSKWDRHTPACPNCSPQGRLPWGNPLPHRRWGIPAISLQETPAKGEKPLPSRAPATITPDQQGGALWASRRTNQAA
jgi:hypothetical protein